MDEIKTLTCSNPNCKHRGQPQPVTNFRPRKSKRGYTSWCVDCLRVDDKKRSAKNNAKHLKIKSSITEKFCSNPNCPNGPGPQPVSNFHIDRHKSDGYSGRCKVCESAYRKSKYDSEKKKQIRVEYVKYENFADKLSPYEECRADKDGYLEVKCAYDGIFFKPTRSQVATRLMFINGTRDREARFYCSDACKKACPIFNQWKFPKGFIQNSSREVQPELRKMVLERDNWTCQKCGKSKEDFPELELHCHHKYPLNEDPVGSADMDNCITLCKDCHHWIHMNVPGCRYAEMKC